jgi:hypothetical protein
MSGLRSTSSHIFCLHWRPPNLLSPCKRKRRHLQTGKLDHCVGPTPQEADSRIASEQASDKRGPCGTPTPYLERSVLGVWNRTPYWISAIDTTVINGHDDLWNARFIALLSGLSGAFDVLEENQVLPNPYPQL